MEKYSKTDAQLSITNKMFYLAVGSVLNNAKDWEGHRLMREKKVNLSSKWKEFIVVDGVVQRDINS